jgi:hypothetical protein
VRTILLSLSQGAIFFMGLFGGFLRQIAPPEQEGEFWAGLATLIAGVVFLLVRLTSKGLDRSLRERRFYRLALLTLPISIVLLAGYHGLFEVRTASYPPDRKIIGGELTERGRKIKETKNLSNEELLHFNAGNPQGVWTEQSINASRMMLGSVYSLSVALFALGLIGGCQGLKDSP